MPLLADVDENGKVTAYDYSKAAVIKYWLDNDVRTMPIIGNATADAIEKAFADAGIDLNDSDLNTDVGGHGYDAQASPNHGLGVVKPRKHEKYDYYNYCTSCE